MTDYQPTDADREAADEIIRTHNFAMTIEDCAAIIAEKMRPEREAADRLADAVELEFKGELKDPNDMFDALYAYREATK
jgi:hypothetical protein